MAVSRGSYKCHQDSGALSSHPPTSFSATFSPPHNVASGHCIPPSDQLRVHACALSRFSHVRRFATPQTAVRQAPPWHYLSKNTGVGCHALFQETVLTQGGNLGLLCLLHWQAHSLPLVLPRKQHQFKESLLLLHSSFHEPILERCCQHSPKLHGLKVQGTQRKVGIFVPTRRSGA